MKYTEGEWFVSGGNEIVSMPSQCKITNRVSGWNQQESEANAQLIANAPAMFEALNHITHISEAHSVKGCTWGDTDLDSVSVAHGYNQCLEYLQEIAAKAVLKVII